MPWVNTNSTHRSSLGLALATLVFITAPLAVGVVHAPAEIAFAGLGLLALLLHLLFARRGPFQIRFSFLGLPLLGGIVFTAFSLLPLPLFLRHWLSPRGTQLVEQSTAALPNAARELVRPVLSLDPPESASLLLHLVAAFAVFVVVADGARDRRQRRLFFRIVLLGGLALFLVSAGHRLVNATTIWGHWGGAGAPFFAPLVNENNLSRTFGVFSLLCVAGGVRTRAFSERVAFFGVATLCAGGVFLTLSRGGILLFGTALVVLGALALRDRKQLVQEIVPAGKGRLAGFLHTLTLTIPLVGLASVGAVFFFTQEFLLKELSSLGTERYSTSKFVLYRALPPILDDFGRVGVGNGALSQVFDLAMGNRPEAAEILTPRLSILRFENVVLETLAAHGVFLGSALLVVSMWALLVLLQVSRRTTDALLLLALVFFILGDLYDVALETGAGMILVGALLGLCSTTATARGRASRRLPAKVAVGMFSLLVLVWAALSPMAFADERARLDQRIKDAPRAEKKVLAERAFARHPLDAHYAFFLAVTARLRGDVQDALAFSNRTLILSPRHARAHVEAARALWVMGKRDQALLEYGLAMGADPKSFGPVMKEVTERTQDPEMLRRALPSLDARTLGRLCVIYGKMGHDQERTRCIHEVAKKKDASPAQKAAVVGLALEAGDHVRARQLLNGLLSGQKPDGDLAAMEARIVAGEKGSAAALTESLAWVSNLKKPLPLLWWQLGEATRQINLEAGHKTLSALRKNLRRPKDRHRAQRGELALLLAAGEDAAALALLRRMTNRHARDKMLGLQRLTLEMKLGLSSEAWYTYKKLRARFPKDEQVHQMGIKLGAERTDK
jgi:tetratricopeptide (TPR) repeat protein